MYSLNGDGRRDTSRAGPSLMIGRSPYRRPYRSYDGRDHGARVLWHEPAPRRPCLQPSCVRAATIRFVADGAAAQTGVRGLRLYRVRRM